MLNCRFCSTLTHNVENHLLIPQRNMHRSVLSSVLLRDHISLILMQKTVQCFTTHYVHSHRRKKAAFHKRHSLDLNASRLFMSTSLHRASTNKDFKTTLSSEISPTYIGAALRQTFSYVMSTCSVGVFQRWFTMHHINLEKYTFIQVDARLHALEN